MMLNINKPRPRLQLSFKNSPSMTEQCHKDEVCIQNIMRKARKTGVLNHVAKYQGEYSDMSNAVEFHEAQNILAAASSMFETVPAHIRKDFHNDPSEYITFMQNPENRERIEKYGLDASHLPKPKPQKKPDVKQEQPPEKTT